MKTNRHFLFHLYMALFLAYLLIPLLVMAGAAFTTANCRRLFRGRGGRIGGSLICGTTNASGLPFATR